MNVNLVPNIEPSQKFIEYFMRSAGKCMVEVVEDPDFIVVAGDVPVMNASIDVTKKPKQPVQIITEPEAAVQKAEQVMSDIKENSSKRSHESDDDASTDSPPAKKQKRMSNKQKFSLLEFSDIFV